MGLRTQKTRKDFPKSQRINKIGTTRNSQQKDRTASTADKASKEIKQ